MFTWLIGLSYLAIHLFDKWTYYTPNPKYRDTPMDSVVKIIVQDWDNEEDKSFWSWLYFSSKGYILTNAHVITNFLWSPIDNINVCYNDKGNKNCSSTAKIVDFNLEDDLAIIQTNTPLPIKPYLIRVEENHEKRVTSEIPLGHEIKVVWFPGVADGSINLTKWIVSWYKYKFLLSRNWKWHKVPSFIRTDTEINHGNSGWAVFDEQNRYIGIPTYINQDGGGKIGYITYWPVINKFLNNATYKWLIDINKQYITDKKIDTDMREIKQLILNKNYADAKTKIDNYTKSSPEDIEWHIAKLFLFEMNEDYLNTITHLEEQKQPEIYPTILFFKSLYYSWKESSDQKKALEYIQELLEIQPENLLALNLKTDILIKSGRLDDAQKANNLAFDIDSNNAEVWNKRWDIQISKWEVAKGIASLENSFSLNANEKVAIRLSELFEKSKDEKKSLIYKIAALVLWDTNPKLLASVSYALFGQIFAEDEISESIKNIQDLLSVFKLNEKKIKELSHLSNEEIDLFISEQLRKAPTDKIRNDVRDFLDFFTTWLLTFTEWKNSCIFNKFDGNPSSFLNMLQINGYSKSEAINIIKFNTIIKCICQNDDYSIETIASCAEVKNNEICGNWRIFSDDWTCITKDQECKQDYGINTHATTDGSCSCNDGYVLNESKDSCISLDGICKGAFGKYSYAWNDYKCYCEVGYEFDSYGNSCVSICQKNSTYINGQCQCNTGYLERNWICITYDHSCQLNYWYWSWWDKDYCYCKAWYKWNDSETYCVLNY